ncbi:hypothetical protein UFOVP1454_43 [uncultured Caudovirales phage]|uniref:Uncharacterized protein n=1 Tax=uncultured Caudovirales phage TaxID=2100421 RepID=A0A6J5SJN0_9CAUD|nr:hypothetical protein UFOVP1454_43 [uncultured Caudovirales phage]
MKGRGMNSNNILCPDNVELVKELDAYLDSVYPPDVEYSITTGYGLRGDVVYISSIKAKNKDGVLLDICFEDDDDVVEFMLNKDIHSE